VQPHVGCAPTFPAGNSSCDSATTRPARPSASAVCHRDPCWVRFCSVTSWRADRVLRHLVSSVRRRHTTTRHHEISTVVSPAIDRLAHCSAAVRRWFLLNGLQLNAGKSEVVFLGTAAQLRSVADVTTIDVAGSSLQVAPPLKSLGVIIDSRLRFDSHARNVTRACNLHIHALLHMRCVFLPLTTSPRRWRAVLSVQDLTTATPFCAAHPRQLSTNSSAFRTTLPGLSANVEDASTPARCSGPSTGFQWGSGSRTRSTFKVRHAATPEYLSDLCRPTCQHGLCDHLRLQRWSSDGPTSISLNVLSASRLHQPGTHYYLLLFDCVTALQHLNDTWKHIYFHLAFSTAISASASLDFKVLYKLYYYYYY